MALLDFSRSQNVSVTAADWVFGTVANVIAALVGWNDARRTRDALSQLSAYELDDIGLTGADIDMISRHARM